MLTFPDSLGIIVQDKWPIGGKAVLEINYVYNLDILWVSQFDIEPTIGSNRFACFPMVANSLKSFCKQRTDKLVVVNSCPFAQCCL